MQNDNEFIVRLAKLRESIEKKESEMANIRKLGTIKAGVSSDYVHNLRAELLSCQREYNFILDQNPSLTADHAKIVIDTFKDHWLEKHEYQILEAVEVDIGKRLQETDWFHRNAKIGEDTDYEIYFICGSFLRRDKNTSSVVYLGEGSIVATIYKQWVYWYEFGSILSDKYIYRRSMDGKRVEKLDWLSNEKTTEFLGESAHCVSEDSVRKMSSDTKTLVIEVFRATKNDIYTITVADVAGELHVNKTFPWTEAPENEIAEVNKDLDATSRAKSSNVSGFLVNNPFYVLDVSVTDNRRTVISKAEEKAFFSEGNECEEAQARLLNPEKRLSAEIDWFFGVPVEKIADIHNAIGETKEISIDGLTGISRINAILFNFTLSNYEDVFELGYAILELDENFSNIELIELLATINSSRRQAGLREATETELENEINRKRGNLRQLISEKVSCLSEDEYVDFITMLADKCVADENYADGVVISDVIDQYEIKMQSHIEEAAEAIYSHIERIKKLSNAEGIETSLSGLIRQIKEWDRLVQPLQLKAMASGIPHSDSAEMGRNIHEFSVWLHNEKELSQLSLSFIGSIKPLFAEIREIYDVFESDCKTLSNIIKSNKDAEQIVLDVDSLKASANSLKIYPTSAKVDEFIFKIKAVNKKAKQIALERDLVEQVRENICYIARDVAITLHNEKEQTELALKIANTLLSEFNDLPSLKTKLSQDVATLNQQILAKARIRQQEEAREQAAKAKGIGCLVWVGLILLFCLIAGGLSECDSSSNNQTSQNSSNYSYSSDAETYTVSLNKQKGTGGTSSVTVKKGSAMPSATAPTRSGYTFKGYYSGTNGSGTKYYNANMTSAHSWDKSSGGTLYAYWEKKADSKFTSSSSVGDSVYVDIKSIFPEIGIYTEGSSNYSEFVCRCITSSGSTVWINMTCSEYKSYFDSDASTSIFNSYADEITFSSPKRIHGVVKKCDSVLSGLSADTGTSLLIDFKSVD